MSKIIFKIDQIKNRAPLISSIHKITGLSLGEIQERLLNGNGIVVQMTLFNNDHIVIVQRIKQLLKTIGQSKSHLTLYEIEPGQTLADTDPINAQITPEQLLNIIESSNVHRDDYGDLDRNAFIVSQE